MSRLRTHWPHPEQGMLSWCGIPAVNTTTSEDGVTCRPCRSLLIHAEADRVSSYGVAVPVAEGDLDASTRRIVDQLKRQEDSPRPWPSWRSAVRGYQRMMDDGHPLRSSGNPSRFEAVTGGGFTPDGDTAQQQAGRLASVGVAIRCAYPVPFVVTTSPVRIEVSAEECGKILVALVCGREHHTRTGTSGGLRKQHHLERFPATDEEVAAHASERMGYPLTVGDIRAIAREGGRNIEAALARGGLVLRRDESLEEGADEVGGDPNKLRGWKAIGEWLGVHPATARDMVKWDPPLPAYRFGGVVEADVEELRAWKQGHSKRIRPVA